MKCVIDNPRKDFYIRRKEWRKNKQFRIHERFIDLKSACNRKGIQCDLEENDLEWPDVCPILKTPLNYLNPSPKEDSPSVDRIDPSKGYIKGNVWVISRKANTMKSSGTVEELKRFAEWINSI